MSNLRIVAPGEEGSRLLPPGDHVLELDPLEAVPYVETCAGHASVCFFGIGDAEVTLVGDREHLLSVLQSAMCQLGKCTRNHEE